MAGDSSNQPESSKLHYRIWRATPDSDAKVVVSETGAYLIGNNSTYVCADETGIAINGNVSFNTSSDQIRYSGLFVGMSDFTKMIPSTIVTLIPSQIPFPPLAFATAILIDLPVFLAALI